MDFDWQTIVALLIVLAAAMAVARRWLRWLTAPSTACGGCRKCPAGSAASDKPAASLYGIQLPDRLKSRAE